MRPSTRVVFLLIAAVLLRGLPSAYAFAAEPGHMTAAPVFATGDDCTDHTQPAQSPADSGHVDASCQIATLDGEHSGVASAAADRHATTGPPATNPLILPA
jgi:hypothetical protein